MLATPLVRTSLLKSASRTATRSSRGLVLLPTCSAGASTCPRYQSQIRCTARPLERQFSTTSPQPSATMSLPALPLRQAVDAPLTRSATFLVLTIDRSKQDSIATVQSTLASTADLIKNVAIRDQQARFSCTVGIGSQAWDDVMGKRKKPKELHPFRAIHGAKHTAVSTPGDLLYHIRADRRDLCFEFERQLVDMLGDSVKVEDITVGFRYFDTRDLLGFVDGTANPVGRDAGEAVFITESEDDSEAAQGGSYVVVQKYLHDMSAWRKLPTHAQEAILGRTKFDNVELDDAGAEDQKSHKTLCTIEKDGEEHDIVRDNMPFGSPADNTFGTYFIGYSRGLWVTEAMLERMFVGQPEGKYDRTLDYSTATTGSVFFTPSADVLDSLGD